MNEDFVMLKGCVPGPKKRVLTLRKVKILTLVMINNSNLHRESMIFQLSFSSSGKNRFLYNFLKFQTNRDVLHFFIGDLVA